MEGRGAPGGAPDGGLGRGRIIDLGAPGCGKWGIECDTAFAICPMASSEMVAQRRDGGVLVGDCELEPMGTGKGDDDEEPDVLDGRAECDFFNFVGTKDSGDEGRSSDGVSDESGRPWRVETNTFNRLFSSFSSFDSFWVTALFFFCFVISSYTPYNVYC